MRHASLAIWSQRSEAISVEGWTVVPLAGTEISHPAADGGITLSKVLKDKHAPPRQILLYRDFAPCFLGREGGAAAPSDPCQPSFHRL